MYENYGIGLKNKIIINPNLMNFKNRIRKDKVQKQKYIGSLNTFNNTDTKLSKISLLKQKQNNNYNLQKLLSYQGKNQIKSVINKKGINRLTQSNEINNITNSFIFEHSYNENNKYFIQKHNNNNINNSFIKQKEKRHLSTNGRIISCDNLSYDTYNPEMTVLINNGIIKNMFLNKKSAKNSYLKNKNSQNINYNNIKNNSYVFQLHKPKIYKSLNERESSSNKNNLNNKVYFNINKLNTAPNFEDINYGQINNEHFNTRKTNPKIIIEKYILNRNNYFPNNLSNMNNSVNNSNKKNIKIMKNYYGNNYDNSALINKSKKIRVDKNNIYKKKHFYHRTDMYNDLNDNPIKPMPILYMKKYSYEPQKENKILLYSNNNNNKNNKNRVIRNQSYNNIMNNQIKKYNKNESLISSSSSDNLSVLADEIMKINLSKSSKNRPNINNSKKINNKLKNKSMNLSDIKINKKRKIKSSVTPMNVNNFFISPFKPKINNNDLNNKIKNKNKDLKEVINSNITLNQNSKIEKKEKDKVNIINTINNKKNELEPDLTHELKKDNKEEEINETLNDDFLLIEQIMNEAENEEKKKRNRHIKFNLDDNIYINFNSNDLITKNIIYKKNEKIESNNDDGKKMDIYYALLKSKTKFNPIIKKFEKDKIKINEDYELNENLEEYEILGDLYNLFFSKEINLLEHNIKKSIDVFMGNK
mgnify:CR=1 FL=1